jgi:murein DD-endopeptidase MepM/ murein hydrolase activator NlpD
VTRPFVPPLSPFGPGHRGVDLAALPGTAVRSAGTGTVRFAAPLAGRGVVVVGSGEIRTTYEPVQAAVRLGQRLQAGDVIAFLDPGHLGCPVAACLHWGALRGRVYLDPLTLPRDEHPRLLPYLVDDAAVRAPPAAAGQMRPVTPPVPRPGLAVGVGASAAVGTGLSLLVAWRRRP